MCLDIFFLSIYTTFNILPNFSFFFTNRLPAFFFFFFLNDPAPTEIYPLPLHDALPISCRACARSPTTSRGRARRAARSPSIPRCSAWARASRSCSRAGLPARWVFAGRSRSEEHTSELQSQSNLVCRLLLEKKKTHTECAAGRSGEMPSTSRYLRSPTVLHRTATHAGVLAAAQHLLSPVS